MRNLASATAFLLSSEKSAICEALAAKSWSRLAWRFNLQASVNLTFNSSRLAVSSLESGLQAVRARETIHRTRGDSFMAGNS